MSLWNKEKWSKECLKTISKWCKFWKLKKKWGRKLEFWVKRCFNTNSKCDKRMNSAFSYKKRTKIWFQIWKIWLKWNKRFESKFWTWVKSDKSKKSLFSKWRIKFYRMLCLFETFVTKMKILREKFLMLRQLFKWRNEKMKNFEMKYSN